jgi:hypothetical protein
MPKLQHMTHATFEDAKATCEALEKLIKRGKVRIIPTPNAAGEWDVGYVAAERFAEAMKDRQGRVILAGPKEIAHFGKK